MPEVLVIGGTGLLGYHSTLELLSRGYTVTSLALPSRQDDVLPEGVTAAWGDLNEMPDAELSALLVGKHAVLYAAGADERITPVAPAARFFYEANVVPTQRMARLSRAAGVKKFVVFGSYTAEFADVWPDLGYRERNGYPRTRLAQEEVAILEGAGAMDVMVLRLPYIFGLAGGRRPLWQFVIDAIRAQPGYVAVPAGSTSAVTVKQVAQAAVGAIESGSHGQRYPINGFNLSYEEFYQLACHELGRDPREVHALPAEAFLASYAALDEAAGAAGREHGIHMVDALQFQQRHATSDCVEEMATLGVDHDDVPAAIMETFRWCIDHEVVTV
jgi:dihydroflavonol-4-reductase